MTYSITKQNELTKIVADELSFYRELFFLADKQRDTLEKDEPGAITEIQDEIVRVQARIEQSERTLRQLRDDAPEDFVRWVKSPQVESALSNIAELIKRTQDVVADCARMAGERKAQYQSELGEIGVGRMLLAGSKPQGQPLYFDQRP
jgi:hypothetical protein